jgi:hypothetical protein
MAELERAPELNYFPQKTDALREAVDALLGELQRHSRRRPAA